MTSATLTTRPSSRPARPWVRAATWQLVGQLYVLAALLVVGCLVVSVALGIAARSGPPQLSGVQFLLQIAPWFPFAVAIHVVTDWFGPHVAAGLTRRSFLRALVAAAFGVALAGAVALTALVHVEAGIFRALGWAPGGLAEGVTLAETPLLTLSAGLLLLLAAGGLSGALVGLTYFRFGAVATVALPLTVAPLVLTAFLADPSTMFTPVRISADIALLDALEGLPMGLRILLGAGILTVSAVLVGVVGRRMPIAPKRD